MTDGEANWTIECGDCVAKMAELAAGSVDLVVTSPPYNLGIAYSSYKDRLDTDAYLAWTLDWTRAVKRVLAEDGSFFLNIGAAPKNPYLPHEVILALREEFVLQNTIHWIKSISVETRDGQQISAGHFKPIKGQRFLNDCHEFVFHLTKTGSTQLDRRAAGVAYQDKSNIARWAHTSGQDRRCRGNAWFIPYKTIVSRSRERPHPATFPVALAEQCIRLHGKGSDTVMLDPFLGIGHSAVAARNLGVKTFHGFDIDDEYLKTARDAVSAERRLL